MTPNSLCAMNVCSCQEVLVMAQGGGKFKFKSKAGATGKTKRFSRFGRHRNAGYVHVQMILPLAYFVDTERTQQKHQLLLVLVHCRMFKQAGEGADYMEGFNDNNRNKCFKCGTSGHWAADCPGHQLVGNIAASCVCNCWA